MPGSIEKHIPGSIRCSSPSTMYGGSFGRWFGITVAGLNAIAALLSIPAYPFWSLAIFALDVIVIYGLAAYGGDPRLAARDQLKG